MTSKIPVFWVLAVFAGLVILADASAKMADIPPSYACGALNDIGLPTLGWRTYIDDECGCSSRAKPIGSGNPFKNSLAYFVDGKSRSVVRVRLIVSVLNPDASEFAHEQFQEAARFLIRKMTSKPPPGSLFRAMANGIDMVYQEGGFTIEITRKEWTMTTDWATFPCHEIRLVIR